MKILVIEDDKKTADFLLKALKEAGYTTIYAADGLNGLGLAQTEPFDLGIIDIMCTMDHSLAQLYEQGKISYDTLLSNATYPDTIRQRYNRSGI